jgi:hypothetical protein
MLLVGSYAKAQDTTKRRTIEITSSFKPVLREAVKINFNAAPPVADTSKPRLTYTIPNQYLFLAYQPGEMKPVALQRDSLPPWENDNYVKVGVGNVYQPLFDMGFSAGDGKNSFLNLFAKFINSNGNLSYQKNSLTDVKLTGVFKTDANLEWNGSIGFKEDGYYLYGFRPDTLKYTADDLRQRFQTFEAQIGMRNTVPTEFGLTYHPTLKVSVFSDNHSPGGNETNSVLNLPLEKSLGKDYAFDLGFTANLTHYNLAGQPGASSAGQNNNLFFLTPAFLVKRSNFFLQASVAPSWDNKGFYLLPNFMADLSTSDQRFTFQMGWIGYYNKGSYQRFESMNPWLAQPGTLLNTRVQEIYAGFKGSIDKHFTYAAKVGSTTYKNMPLFVNDSINGGRDFLIRYESSMQALQLHGEVSYLQGEQFTATASLNVYQYTNLKTEAKAWGLIPVDLNTNLKWEAFKDFWAKLDLYAFEGAQYRAADGSAHSGQGGVDMNAGVDYRITRQVDLWFQLNNLFDDRYERWHQYPVYARNFLIGIVWYPGRK